MKGVWKLIAKLLTMPIEETSVLGKKKYGSNTQQKKPVSCSILASKSYGKAKLTSRCRQKTRLHTITSRSFSKGNGENKEFSNMDK